jgi:phosphohistidine phosphatase
MKTLLLMRHAKSSWASAGVADHDRPLNERGEKASVRMGQLLRERNLRPDVLLLSTALRAMQTAERVAKAAGLDLPLRTRRDLYLAPPSAYIALAQTLPRDVECALVIGHNPGLEELVAGLAGRHERMPTAALAQASFDVATWADLTLDGAAETVHVFRPKELD